MSEPSAPSGPAAPSAESVRAALGRVTDPELRRPITELDMVGDVSVDEEGNASVDIVLTIVGCPAADRIEADTRAAVASVPGIRDLTLRVGVMTPAQRTALTERLRGARGRQMPFGPGSLTRVVAVTSGKGGVGKSTLTANLAVEIARRGLLVGLIDADVHGFSIPGILGMTGAEGAAAAPTKVGDLMIPPEAYGVKVISIGMFLEDNSPVAWRGPMLHRTLNQFLTDVYFGDLDVLLLDLPPGTGDVAISLGQLLPNAEVLVVTTPQASAAEVAERSGLVARQTGQRVAGVIENMAGMVQSDGSVLELFGSGGGRTVADRLSAGQPEAVPLLASVPLSPALRIAGDVGAPIVLDSGDPAAVAIRAIADGILAGGRGLSGRSLPFAPSS